MSSTRSPTRWALLIGIDFYFSGNARINSLGQTVTYPPLYGCVHDVEAVEEYLRSIGECNITKLTASHGDGDQPAEDEDKWPTHENIELALKQIIKDAQPGDLVYIHYSGHGIRRDRLGHTHLDEGDNTSGTALVPTNVTRGGAYLTGYSLGRWVQTMVEAKQLRVTVVLDSCYSGRGMRDAASDDEDGGMGVRTAKYLSLDDSVLASDESAELQVAVHCSPAADEESDERDAAVRTSWLSDPTGCVVLSACEVEQTAKEISFGTTARKQGVFTYWMCEILKQYPPHRPPSYDQVIDHVRSRIRTMRARAFQDPVLRGQTGYQFFKNEKVHLQPASRVLSVDQRSVTLSVGRAQGVAKGAVYNVYPESWETEWGESVRDGSSPQPNGMVNAPHQVVVESVSEFRSAAVPSRSETIGIQPGSRAVLNVWALGSPTFIEFEDDVRGLNLDLEALQALLQRTPGLSLHGANDRGEDQMSFRVSLDASRTSLEILDDKGTPLTRVPRIPLTNFDKTMEELARILNHLARFRAIQHLRPHSQGPRATLKRTSFDFKLTTDNGLPIPVSPTGAYEVNEDQELTVWFANRNIVKPVYVALFCLTGRWGILKLFPEGRQPSEQLHGQNPIEYPLAMEVPRDTDDDPSDVYDVIRACVYVGVDPPVWDELILPGLRVTSESFPGEAPPAMADLADSESDMEADHSREPKERKKRALRSATQEGQWAFFDLVIHTSRPEPGKEEHVAYD